MALTPPAEVPLPRSSAAALDAAARTDPALHEPGLRAAFEACRRLHAEHGKTYYLATLLLPPAKRPYVWALYGFARYADEFVDSLTDPDPEALVEWSEGFLKALEADGPTDPVGRAMAATMRRWEIPRAHVEAFLDSMRMDITETGYATYEDLRRYVYGSAAVIGLQMLPVLEPVAPGAEGPAQALGEAFQLSNFIRDVGEDLDRGRVYLPAEDLDAFGVTREDLLAARAAGTTPRAVRELLAFETARTRELYAQAQPGLAMVHPTSRDCLRTAYELYGGILDVVEAAGFDVVGRRVAVGVPRRLAVAVPGLVRARLARVREARWQQLPG
ncbi:squalene/phytoene synthase family protein [Kineococcus sp. T13]|uniref:phytoene/squalene synthase family protein n=1 Tax=Kineococcus vitellinus TaxID=2696565 RepID=UPI00141353FC|nr:phytoene/squalene synthase family protein [Kineococcus vitellinus]NAZ75896.1 squalene/phytoene synthase family protein [Kineococcus vitellinus]